MKGYIEIITGSLGGGKTALAVEYGIEHLMGGGHWYTNIEIKVDAVRAYMAERGLEFDETRLHVMRGSTRDFFLHVGRGTADSLVMVTIDEAHLDFFKDDWKALSRDMVEFNSLVRKFDIGLYYITQDANNLDKAFRRLTNALTSCRNMKDQRFFGVIKVPIPLFFRLRWVCHAGQKPSWNGCETVWRSWAFGLYDSDALLGASAEKWGKMTVHQRTALKKVDSWSMEGFRRNVYAFALFVLAFAVVV